MPTRIAVPIKRGFGSSLIEQSAKGEGGTAKMSVEPEGIVWDIAMPLPRLQRTDEAGKSGIARTNGDKRPDEPVHGVAPPAKALSGKHLLVIEDEPLLALDLLTQLEEAGATVVAPSAHRQRRSRSSRIRRQMQHCSMPICMASLSMKLQRL